MAEEGIPGKIVIRCFGLRAAADVEAYINSHKSEEVKVAIWATEYSEIYADLAEIQTAIELGLEDSPSEGVDIPDVIILVDKETEGSERVWLYANEILGDYYEFFEYTSNGTFVKKDVSKEKKIFEEKHKPMLTEIMVAAKERARRKTLRHGLRNIERIIRMRVDEQSNYEYADRDWLKACQIMKEIKDNIRHIKRNYYSKFDDKCKYPSDEFDRESEDYSDENKDN